MLDRPTVSIQNGKPICLRISLERDLSSSEKKGLGSALGSAWAGRKSTSRPRRSKAMRSSSAPSLPWGALW